ncbi:MAG: YceI family protein [Proteobacteria bacterium]|nr:YceI family protein [Pseudomonadota bacterium]MDA0995130.1 YceI family protein [Pseudomonadota bacterium]
MRRMSLLLLVLVAMASYSILAQDSATIQAPEPAANKAFRIDSEASWLRVLLTPDGPLKRFGHYHAISHHGISGSVMVAPNPLESTIMLELSVADLDVDNPDSRALEGEDFAKEVPQKDIDGTRANMLGESLLNAERFPTIQIQSTAIEGEMPDVNIVTTIIVAGIENTVSFPASIELTDDSFIATGQLEITHGELGLSPFTAMGGALSVGDVLVLKYEISGVPVTQNESLPH